MDHHSLTLGSASRLCSPQSVCLTSLNSRIQYVSIVYSMFQLYIIVQHHHPTQNHQKLCREHIKMFRFILNADMNISWTLFCALINSSNKGGELRVLRTLECCTQKEKHGERFHGSIQNSYLILYFLLVFFCISFDANKSALRIALACNQMKWELKKLCTVKPISIWCPSDFPSSPA